MSETGKDEFLGQDFAEDIESVYKKELERIRDIILRMFCPLEEIDGLMAGIEAKAREADKLVEEIKSHPFIQKNWLYKNGVFTRDDGAQKASVPDGQILLRQLVHENMNSFGSLFAPEARRQLLDFIDSGVKNARDKARLLQERGDMSVSLSDFGIIKRVKKEAEEGGETDVKNIGSEANEWIN